MLDWALAAEGVYKTSVQCAELLMSSICGKGTIDISGHAHCVNTARKVSYKQQQTQQSEHFKDLVGSTQPLKKQNI